MREGTLLGIPARIYRVSFTGELTYEINVRADSHLRVKGSSEATDGWITSAGTTTLTHEPIALAMLRGGRARIGAEVELYDAGRLMGRTRVVNLPFFDATGDRMNA